MSDVDEAHIAAELYREQLGLMPWGVHAAEMEARYPGSGGRRTGATTKGLLYAIARVRLEGKHTLYISHENDRCISTYCRNRACDLIAELGLDIQVREVRGTPARLRGLEDPVVYVDHVTAERRRPSIARLMASELAAANAHYDAKERELDTYGYGGGPICPHCHSKDVAPYERPGEQHCWDCGRVWPPRPVVPPKKW